MAVTTTSRFGITRWSAGSDPLTRTQMDGSHAAIETNGALYLQGTTGARPTAGTVGRYYYATDTNIFSYDDGTAWRVVAHPNALANTTLNGMTFTGTTVLPSTTSIGTVTNTEISYLSGVTSSIQTQIGTKAPTNSPSLTGTPLAPTAAADTNTTQLATTAFVIGQASSTNPLMNGSVSAGSSLKYSRTDHVHATDTTRAPLASPTFTGTVTLPAATSLSSPAFTGTPVSVTAAVDTNTTQVATTAFVVGQASSTSPLMNGVAAVGTSLRYARTDHVHAIDTSRAPLASPTFTGTVVLPSTTSIGTVTNTELGYLSGITSAVQTQLNAKAPLASPTFTGTVTVPAAVTSSAAELTITATTVTFTGSTISVTEIMGVY
jgi:hypothetical protein